MLELFSAWREVLHISEWTGLSLGALVVLAALVYFVHIPFLTAVRIAVLIVTAYFCLLLGDAVGTRDKQRQWDIARASAAKAQEERDARVQKDLDAKYHPQLEELQKQSAANQEKADALQKLFDAGKGRKAGSSCQLGRYALRLRRQ